MRILERKHGKRRKQGLEASLYDLPNETFFESIFPQLDDIDIHNLGLACGQRIEKLANDYLPIGGFMHLDV